MVHMGAKYSNSLLAKFTPNSSPPAPSTQTPSPPNNTHSHSHSDSPPTARPPPATTPTPPLPPQDNPDSLQNTSRRSFTHSFFFLHPSTLTYTDFVGKVVLVLLLLTIESNIHNCSKQKTTLSLNNPNSGRKSSSSTTITLTSLAQVLRTDKSIKSQRLNLDFHNTHHLPPNSSNPPKSSRCNSPPSSSPPSPSSPSPKTPPSQPPPPPQPSPAPSTSPKSAP